MTRKSSRIAVAIVALSTSLGVKAHSSASQGIAFANPGASIHSNQSDRLLDRKKNPSSSPLVCNDSPCVPVGPQLPPTWPPKPPESLVPTQHT